MNYFVHNVPGRLRVKIPLLQRNAVHCDAVKELLLQLDGVERVLVTELTGSVVINYDQHAIKSKDIIDTLKKNGYFDESMVISQDAHIQTAASKAGVKLGRAVFQWAVGKALEDSALSLLAVLI